MKRNFLLMLLLTLLPFAGWAAVEVSDELSGGYTVTISEQYLALTNAETGVAAPAITKVSQVTTGTTTWEGAALTDAGVYVKNGTAFQKVETPIKAEGIYYKGAYITVGDPAVKKLILVPFYVGVPNSHYDYIYDNESWTASYTATAPALGGLKNYYEANTDEDRYNFEEIRWAWASDKANNGGVWPEWCRQDWLGAINAPLAAYPWIVPYLKDVEGAYVLVFKYPGYNDFMPWGTTTFGTTGDRVRGCASIPEELGFQDPVKYPAKANAQGELTDETTGKIKTVANTTYGNDNALPFLINVNKETGVVTPDPDGFDIEKFNMLLVPASLVLNTVDVVDVKSIATATIAPSPINLPYTGAVQKPVFTSVPATPTSEAVAANAFVKDGATTLVEGVDYEIEWTAGADYTNFGTDKPFLVKGIGLYDGTLNGSYNIVKGRIAINLANIHKTYGDPDPALPENATDAQIAAYAAQLNFSIDAATPLQGVDEKSDIAKYLVVKRVSGADNQGENVREYDYWYDYSADYATESNYDIIFLQNSSKLVIDKAPLKIMVSPNTKVYNTADPTAYTWVKDPNNNTYNPFKYDDNASNVNITITRAAGEHVGEYAFNAVADNYEVTVVNSFRITTTNSTEGVTASFGNQVFVYTGQPQTPTPAITDANGPVTFDDVRYSTDHTNVGTVTVTVTLRGDYNDKDFQTSFNIEKKELTIKAKNYALNAGASDPASFAIEYDGWVNEEGTINGPDRTKIPQSAASTTNPVFFKTPSGVKKVNTDAAGVYNLVVIEDAASNNYKFKYEEGKLTFGKAILDIYAVDANKTYGDQDPKFTLSLTVQQEGETSATPTDEKPITIGGVRQINPVRPGADTDEDAGTYRGAITFDKMPTVLAGYAVNYHKGDFTINKADLTITAKDQSKTYGQTDAEADLKFGYTLEGVTITGNKNNEATEDILTGTWTYYAPFSFPQQHTNEVIIAVECVSQNNPHSENAGEYTITPRLRGQAGQANDFLKNYNLVFKTGKLTINKAELIIKPIPQTKQFGEEDPDFAQLAKVLEVTGLQRNDTKESVLGQIQGLTVKRDKPWTGNNAYKNENVDNYPIRAYVPAVPDNLYSGAIANYTWTIQNEDGNGTIDLVITPVQLIVKALDQSIDYGAEINGYMVKFFKPILLNEDAQPTADAEEVEVEMSDEQIKKIINPLTATTTKVQVNENGFQWNGFKDSNYAIAKVVVDGVQKDDFRNGYLTIYALQTIPLDETELANLDLPAVKVIDEATGKDKDLLKKVLEDHKGLTVNVSLPGRKMDADEWYAYVLPFKVTPRMVSQDAVWGYAAMETLDLNKSTEKSILFELQMFEVPANTPFIVKIDKDLTAAEAKAIVLNNVTIDKEFDYLNETPASEGNGVSFVGQYESTVGFGANQMYLAKVKGYDHREFWRGGEKSASVAFVSTNACLEFTDANAAAGARVYIEEEDGTVTAIGGVESDATVDSEGWYNVSGIKLNAAPAQKGIFIKDGKKVLVK